MAAVVFTLYHAINAYRLASGRHLSMTAAAMIVAPPYLAEPCSCWNRPRCCKPGRVG